MLNHMKATKDFALLGLASMMMFAGTGAGVAADRDVVDAKGGSVTASAPLSGAVALSGDGYVTTEQQGPLKSDLETLSVG